MFVQKSSGRILLKLGLTLVVLAGIAFAVFNGLQKTARVKTVKRGTVVDAVTGSVTVDADGGTNKELKAEADGKVVECAKIVEGVKFKEGEVLLQMDTKELERVKDQETRKYTDGKKRAHESLTAGKPELLAKADELTAEELAALFQEVSPQRKLARENLEKAKRLFQLNNISSEDLRNAERALENLDLELRFRAIDEKKGKQDFDASMQTLELQIERMQIKAPSDGEIVESFIWKGALIGRGTVVAKFMSNERVVAARISEESFGKVRVGQEALVRLLTYGERNFEAKVSKLLPTADDAQKFKVFLDVKVDSPDQLRPHSTGEVTITVDKRPDSLMMSRTALFDGDKVYVVKNGRVERRKIKVGYVNLTEVQVLDGLVEGDHVIVEKLDEFFGAEGDRVRIEVLP